MSPKTRYGFRPHPPSEPSRSSITSTHYTQPPDAPWAGEGKRKSLGHDGNPKKREKERGGGRKWIPSWNKRKGKEEESHVSGKEGGGEGDCGGPKRSGVFEDSFKSDVNLFFNFQLVLLVSLWIPPCPVVESGRISLSLSLSRLPTCLYVRRSPVQKRKEGRKEEKVLLSPSPLSTSLPPSLPPFCHFGALIEIYCENTPLLCLPWKEEGREGRGRRDIFLSLEREGGREGGKEP